MHDDDELSPRWPVFVRFGDQEEVGVGEVFADGPADLLLGIAGLLREMAEHIESRAAGVE